LCSGCAADRITHLYAEWDVSVSQCDEVSRERDEARDRVAHLDAEWDVLAGQLDATESERDEARAEVERLRSERRRADTECPACDGGRLVCMGCGNTGWLPGTGALLCEDPDPCGICEPCLDALPPVDTSRWCPATYGGHQCHREPGHEGKHYVGAHGGSYEWDDPEPGE
jgi:hypothetical protein